LIQSFFAEQQLAFSNFIIRHLKMEFFLSLLFKAQITRNTAEDPLCSRPLALHGANASEIWNLAVTHI